MTRIETTEDCEVHHPGVQHSATLAGALSVNSRLIALRTRVQFGRCPALGIRVARRLPAIGNVIDARSTSLIDDVKIDRVLPWTEVRDRTVTRFAVNEFRQQRRAQHYRELFADAACHKVSPSARYVISTDGSAGTLFERLRSGRPDTTRVLDVAHPYVEAAWNMLVEDSDRHGFALSSYDDFDLDKQRFQDARRELELADLFLVGSNFTASTLRAYGADPDRIKVVPYGYDLSAYLNATRIPTERHPKLRLAFVGALSERKGVSLLLRAMHEADERRLPVSLTIVGGSSAGYRCEPASLGPNVRLLGRVSQGRLLNVLASADFLVLPSMCEGYGRVIIEAMAAGCGVITTERTGAPDILDSYPSAPVLLVDTNQRHRLSAVFEELVEGRQQATDVVQEARKVAVNYSVESYASALDAALPSAG